MNGAHDPDAYFSRHFAPLVKAATVRIHAPREGYPSEGAAEPPLWGSGFFVAPNWVLTCAHVALQGEGGEVGVSFEGGSARGRVEWAEPARRDSGLLPAPDLALIRLLQPTSHACCWLSPRTIRAHGGERVAYFGYTEIAGTTGAFDGRCTIKGEFGGDGTLRLGNEDEMPAGLSGGPLVDIERGEVIGVVKGRRSERDGGLGTSIAQLRRIGSPGARIGREEDEPYSRVLHAHDRYHADRHADVSEARETWTEAQSGLPGTASTVTALTPKRRVVLLGLLAQLPPPISTPALTDLVDELLSRRGEGLPLAPRSWREGLEIYLERLALRDAPGELEAVLRYAVHAATAEHPYPAAPGAAPAVWDWVRDLAATELTPLARSRLGGEWHARLRARAAVRARRAEDTDAARRPLPTVLLEITERAWEQGRFDWYVTAHRPSGDLPLGEGRHGTALADLPAELAGPLGEAFRRSDEPDRPAILEVALRQALLGLDVDTWRIPPGEPPIGELRPVVVRCADRPAGGEHEGAGGPDPGPRERWTRLHEDGMEHACVDCEEGRPETVTPDALADLGPRSFPVLCHAPGGGADPEAVRRIIGSGHPVALWRRERMDPVCGEYHRGVLRTVKSGTTAHRLPSAVRELRAGIGAAEPEAYWSRGITLLYDDPARPLPGDDDALETP